MSEAAAVAENLGVSLSFVTSRPAIKRLAAALSRLDSYRIKQPAFRCEICSVLRFTRREAEEKGNGLLLKSLCLPPGGSLISRIFNHPEAFDFLAQFGLLRLLQQHAALQISRSGAIALVSLPAVDKEKQIRAGEALQRIWLTLTRHGLSVHPLGSYPVFFSLLGTESLDDEGTRLIEDTQRLLSSLFPDSQDNVPMMLLRLGYTASKPDTWYHRLPLEDILVTEKSCCQMPGFDYDQAFCRNLGIVSRREQPRLRQATIAIPGMGGVGGIHLLTLARMGIGGFHLADFDKFELHNFNRQFGAFISSVGKTKCDVMLNMAMDINPELRSRTWPQGITPDNIEDFLTGVDVVVDSLDAYCIRDRRLLFNKARQMGVPVISAGPIGLSCSMLVFTPDSLSFDDYFNYDESITDAENFLRFIVGITPWPGFLSYMDMAEVKTEEHRGPSLAPAVDLCAGFAAIEVLKLLLNRRPVAAAPCYHYFDPYLMKFKRSWMPLGNRNPLQRLRYEFLRRKVLRRTLTGPINHQQLSIIS